MSPDAVQLTELVGLIDLVIQTTLLGSGLQVDPEVLEVQLPGVDLLGIVEPVGALEVELVIEGVEDVLVLPVDGFIPIQDVSLVHETVEFPSVGVLRAEVLLEVVLLEHVAEQAVPNPVHELAVLVVRDLVDVDVKGGDGDRLGAGRQGVGHVLVARAHRVGAVVDVVHPIGIHLHPILPRVHANHLSGRAAVATGQRDGAQGDDRSVSHGFYPYVERCPSGSGACRTPLYAKVNVQVSSFVAQSSEESGVCVTGLHGNPFEVEHVRDEDFV